MVGPDCRGLTIDTPFGSVVDLGTEFAVEVSDERGQVEVFDGAVELRNRLNEKNVAEQIIAGERAAFRAGRPERSVEPTRRRGGQPT